MPVTKIVVLMMENRSFDHMLGLRRGVNGLLNRAGTIDSSFANLLDPSDSNSKSYSVSNDAPYAVDPTDIYTSQGSTYGGPSHSFPAATEQLCGDKDGHVNDHALLNGFIKSYYDVLVHSAHRANPTDDEIRLPMQAFGGAQLPVLWALADAFLVCDNWFSEVPGPTQPNRLFVHAATSTGFAHNVWGHPIVARTIYEELERINKTWNVFYFDLKDTDAFPQIKNRVDCVLPFAQFYAKAKSGDLPNYTFLCPRYNDAPEGRANTQHAPDDVRDGEDLIADVYEALRAGPDWEETLLIVTYDEHGGFYDHVSPPPATPPDGFTSPTDWDKDQAAKNHRDRYLLKPNYEFGFDRLGLRVPTVLVSPVIAKGVDSTLYQHTSILATLRDLFGTKALTKRDATAQSFARLLDGPVRSDTPEKLPRPDFSNAEVREMAMQVDQRKTPTSEQHEMWPMLSQLDGHPDSGKITAPPQTRFQAAQYVKQRNEAHAAYHLPRLPKAGAKPPRGRPPKGVKNSPSKPRKK